MIKKSIIKAYNFAEKVHRHQKRKFTGLPYFTHPKAVARIVEDLHGSEDMICAALLHDVIEDCSVKQVDILKKFNKRVGEMVLDLTNDPKEMKKHKTKGHYLCCKMVKMDDDTLTVKLADRLHNVMHLNHDKVSHEFVKKYCAETSAIINVLEEFREDKNAQHLVLMALISSYCMYLMVKIMGAK